MIENTKVKILFDKDEAIEVRIPSHMNLKVIKIFLLRNIQIILKREHGLAVGDTH